MSLFDYSVNLQPMLMDIRSEQLEPISTSTRRRVFRLDAAGYLDQNSLLLFKVANAANNRNLRANLFNGGLGAIKRATLQVGDYILNDTVDVAKISTLMNLGTANRDTKNEYSGVYFQNQLHTAVLGAYNPNKSPEGGVGSLYVEEGKSGIKFGDQDAAANDGAYVNSCVISNDADNNVQFGIPLGVILPCLQGREIPLFLFQDYRILITVEFYDAPLWCNDISQVANTAENAQTGANRGQAATPGSLVYSDVKLQVDYIIYPSEIQEAARQQTNAQGGLTLDFYDIVKVEKDIPQTNANVEQKVEHRIGADQKEVHSIYMIKRLNRLNGGLLLPKQEDKVMLDCKCNAMNQESYNVTIDGVDVFQEDKYSPASQYDETTNCLGGDLAVERPIYYMDENTIFSRLADKESGLLGTYKPLCLDLRNGEPMIMGGGRQIGAYPIIWKYSRKPTGNFANPAAGAATNIINAQNDSIDVDYFLLVSRVANIKSTPQGTSVMVSY